MKITVDTTRSVTHCQKCGKTGVPISRHHKGFDSYIAIYNARVRREYHLFLDCCPLCDECHMEIHWLYIPFVAAHIGHSSKGILALRTLLIDVCDQWLSGSLTPEKQGRPVSPEFRTKWKASSLTSVKQETG